MDKTIQNMISARLNDSDFRARTVETLRKLVNIDTMPTADIPETARRESEVFDCIEGIISEIDTELCRTERRPIRTDIEDLRDYTLPFYARGETGEVPDAESVYRSRENLSVRLSGCGEGRPLAFNSHIDVVGPYFGFRREGDRLVGRGTADDKGQCVMMLEAVRLLAELAREEDVMPVRDVDFQFVIEEEMGGNGSLSLASDPDLDWGCVVVCEPTELEAHPANRGATWYRIELETDPKTDLNATVLASRILLALREEGEKIRAESDHPLFPERPVQTCNGEFGPWGLHPSRVCPMAGVFVENASRDGGDLREAVESACEQAIETYCQRYGDATEKPDPDDPDSPMVLRHCDIIETGDGFFVVFYGKSGHMGKIRELDCASTKAALAVIELENLTSPDTRVCFAQAPPAETQNPPGKGESPEPQPPARTTTHELVIEGGQGFVPTHSIEEVQQRIRETCTRVAREYAEQVGAPADAASAVATFSRLHNNAFERPVDCPGMEAMREARKAAGMEPQETIRGWEVSCDARLFADLCPDTDVVTLGSGELRHAHSENESIKLEEILTGTAILVHMALLYGT